MRQGIIGHTNTLGDHMLFEATITPYRLLAVAGWLTAGVIVVADIFVPYADAAHLGVLIGIGSAVLNVRSFIHQFEDRHQRALKVYRETMYERVELRPVH